MEGQSGLKAVLFDLDETLLKLPINYDELRKKLREYASRLGVECDFRQIIEGIEEASRRLGEEFRRMCYELVELYELEAAEKPIVEHDTLQLLEKLKKMGLKIGVVSRNSKKCVIASLEKAGLLRYVDVAIGREDTLKTKPNPEPIIHALMLLGVKVEEAVYVGDHPYDLAAAFAAGVKFIALGDKIKGYEGPRVRRLEEVAALISV
ncbi:MAG: HAD-IA family hydrolase [Candidatus Jordarchaeales archaeon]